jgi:NTP pyrophosphatase (non-canonical NTP hydrolase)
MISSELMGKLLEFRAERDWEQFHNLRTLSTSIVLEAAELAEFTQWKRDSELEGVLRDDRAAIIQEIADLAILLSYLANDLSIDIEAAVSEKLELNRQRYPVEKSKGSALKYDKLG